MDQQWQSYGDGTPNRQPRYPQSTSQQQTRDMGIGSAQHPQGSSAFAYEAYNTPSIPTQAQTAAASPSGTPHAGKYSGDGDVPMEDADPYNKMKYPSRPNHQHRTSGPYLSQDDSSAARRYSPMKALSPTSPYATSPLQSSQPSYSSYASQSTSARQSPTRPPLYSSQSQSFYATPSKL